MIQPTYIRIGMVMAHDPRNALHIGGIDRQRRKKALHQRRTFPLLMLSIGVAILLAAQWAGNVVNNGRKLQKLLRMRVQPLLFANGLRQRSNLQKVVNVVQIPLRTGDHLFHYGCSEHTAALLSGITYQGRNRGASGLMLDFILNYIESSLKRSAAGGGA